MLLPRYAAGALMSVDADAVRAHLATGCSDCLEALFRMPIGMPRDVPSTTARGRTDNGGPAPAIQPPRIPAPAGPASGTEPSWLGGAVALLLLAALVAWLLWMRRG